MTSAPQPTPSFTPRISQRLVASWAEGPAVEVKNVTKVHFAGTPDEVRALDKVHSRFNRGKVNVLWGPSGSGKTTLLSLIGSLDTPSEGEIEVGGLTLAKMTGPQRALYRRHRVGFHFQEPNLLEDVPLWANVTLGWVPDGAPASKRMLLGKELLAKVGLDEKWDRIPAQLSGGEARRAALARSLAHAPSLVLADEPTSQLDEANALKVMEILALLATEGRTVILASHDPLVKARASKVYYLRGGRLEAEEEVR